MARSNQDSAKPKLDWPERGHVYNTNIGMNLTSTINWNLISFYWLMDDRLTHTNHLLMEQNHYLKEILQRLIEKDSISPEEVEHEYE